MEQDEIIGSRQIRAARAVLDWSQDDLALAAGLSIATIRKLEDGALSPRSSTMSVLRQALEEAGIEFIQPDGVRRRSDEVVTYRGDKGLTQFQHDMIHVLRRNGGDVMLVEPAEGFLLAQSGGESFFSAMGDLPASTSIKCLLTGLGNSNGAGARMECRHISTQYVDPIPFCVFGDRFALLAANTIQDKKIIVMRSTQAVQCGKRQFLSMWDKAMSLPMGVLLAPLPRRAMAHA